jgi:LysR family pca operon transcriptional activator
VKRQLQHELKFRHLRVIDAILSHESILQAARALGLSQPALTKTLQQVEDMVGARLFERHVRGVTPNEYGRAVGEAARRILIEATHLEDQLDALDGSDGGLVSIGALPIAAAGILPGALARFQAAYPHIEVEVVHDRTEPLLAALAAREVDFIVGRLYERAPDGLVRRAFYDEGISVLARSDHPIFRLNRPVCVGDLADYPVALPSVSQKIGQEIEAFIGSIGFQPRAPLRSSSMPLIRETLYASDSLAVMPTVMLVGDIMRGNVRIVLIPAKGAPRPAGVILRSGAPLLKNAAAFVEIFRAYAEDVDRLVRP